MELEYTEDVKQLGFCGCTSESENYFNGFDCGGCSMRIEPVKIGVLAVHWRGQHWHVSCAFIHALKEMGEMRDSRP